MVNIPGLGRLRRSAQWIRNRFVQGAVILLYHRVSQLPTDPQLLCVTPGHFAEHLEILRKKYSPMGLQELSQVYRQGNLPQRAVVVTFDDGYYDNLSNAKPLLERYDIPATVFVTTGYVGRQRECWWDELERLLLQPGTLPDTLSLTLGGKHHHWKLGDASSYSEEAYECYRTWNVRKKRLSGRQDLYNALHPLIRPLADGSQREVMDVLFAWAGLKPTLRSTHRTLSTDEVLCMAKGRLIDIGAHTITHPVLSLLPPAMQQAEIQGSMTRLEETLGRPVTSFAYPYGLRSDYSAETIATVKQSGFTCASSSYEDNVWQGSDRFQLPRRIVFDWDGEQFARKLRQWLGG
jgi:peptidoglycan/xylan/chitin deacetylase (PgdA/CDA1 family)